MQITKVPRAELERIAREQYERHYGEQAPPKVRNAQAFSALGEPRALRWAGHAYTVPPVPFRLAAKLVAVSNVLADDDGDADSIRIGRRRVREAVALTRAQRVRALGLNPFRNATGLELRAIINELLYTPDESPTPQPSSGGTINLIDGVMEYLHAGFPTTPDGLPVSWQMYQYAIRYIGRSHARQSLRDAQSIRAGMSDTGFKPWAAEMRAAAGWH